VLGIKLDAPAPGEFLERIAVLVENLGRASIPTAVVGISVLVLIVVWNRLVPRVPGYIVALVGGTAVVAAMRLPIETIGTRFGGIPAGLPDVHIPNLRPDLILSLLSATLTVAMLGAIESLLSAVVADRMSGRRHNSNVELFAQGVANIVSPMVGGLPATGAIARTATNVRSGAQTPVAGIIHSCTLLVILLFASSLAALVPMTVLGAILLVVAYNMGEWREIAELWKNGWTDRIVWMWTFALTVLADLTVAVEAGMIIAARGLASTGEAHERGRVSSPRGSGEHPSARRGCAEPGRRHQGDNGAAPAAGDAPTTGRGQMNSLGQRYNRGRID
jgi:SulP family sulfate permease